LMRTGAERCGVPTMETRDKDEGGAGKEQISIWVDREVSERLVKKARELERSRSWMANHVLRVALGLPPSGGVQ